MKQKYYCPSCEEIFHADRVNVNERHHCGTISIIDWTYRREEETRSD
mgnify:CR=1 FL=1